VFSTLINAWKLPDLRKKLLFTVFIVVLYRIGATIPVPYISSETLQAIFAANSATIFGQLNVLSGSALAYGTLFALSISPYITSSIVMQLLTIAIPALERMSKDGEEGKKKINTITRYVTVGLALITAYGYYTMMRSYGVLTNTGVFAAIVIIACYSAGASLIMWLAEKINENGIGNGISIILLANILSRGFALVESLWNQLMSGGWNILFAILSIVIALLIVTFIVLITNSERRLPVQYAKKVVGRKMYGGQSTNLPLKLQMSGVMPIIFANSIVSLPATIGMFVTYKEGSFWDKLLGFFGTDSWFYVIVFFVLIIAFSYFYIAISFNPVEVANNLKKNGGFIPGIRPGKPTSDYITKVLSRITLIGALFLSIIAVFPLIINICASGVLGSIAFSGSSLLIVVGVILELYREIEAQMTMRHYKGFLE